MSDSIKENDYDRKCICGESKVCFLLLNNQLPNNQRLLCDKCYKSTKGYEPAIIYKDALSEMYEQRQQKENFRKNIVEQQSKPIEKLQQLLNSYKQDLMYAITSIEMCVNEWIRIIQIIKEFQPQNNSFDEIYSLRCCNFIKDQKEVIQLRHQIKHCNIQFCNKLLHKIQNFSNLSKLQEGYQYLLQSLFQIEPKIETNSSELLKSLQNMKCSLHQHPIIKVQYQDSKNSFGKYCNKCENRMGESLEIFSNDWSTYLEKKEYKIKKINQFLRDKIQQQYNQQIYNYHKINHQFNQAIFNLFQYGVIQLQQQLNHIEELKNAELDLNIFSMVTSMVSKEDDNKFMQKFYQINKNTAENNPIKKIDNILNQQIQNNFVLLNQGINIGKMKIYDPTRYGPIQFKPVSQQNNESNNESCSVVSFYSSKSLMITNQGNKIYIYQLNNIFWEKKLQVIKNNNELSVTCLIHSKFCNSFVSTDENLVIWKYCDKIEFCQQYVFNKMNGYINCLIVNKDETQLISGGNEIQVYQLNFNTSQLKYDYSLQEHKGRILSISLNDSETYLISCCDRQQIIVRCKKEEIWVLMQTVDSTIQECSNRLSFIRNDLFILVSDLKQDKRNANRISFFDKFENCFYEQKQNQLLLDYQSEDAIKNQDQPGFPIIQLHDHNLILIKNRNKIYTMRQQLDGTYWVLKNPMEFLSSQISGNILYIPQKDQCYLVVWDQSLKTYQIVF